MLRISKYFCLGPFVQVNETEMIIDKTLSIASAFTLLFLFILSWIFSFKTRMNLDILRIKYEYVYGVVYNLRSIVTIVYYISSFIICICTYKRKLNIINKIIQLSHVINLKYKSLISLYIYLILVYIFVFLLLINCYTAYIYDTSIKDDFSAIKIIFVLIGIVFIFIPIIHEIEFINYVILLKMLFSRYNLNLQKYLHRNMTTKM